MVVLCGSILQERMSEWVQCPVNVCFAFNSDQIPDTARGHIGGLNGSWNAKIKAAMESRWPRAALYQSSI